MLPLCYRDSSCGFYGWRNRWQDGQDTVISVLQNRTSGYMGAKPDGKDLTFYFPTAAAAPEVKVEGAAAVVGKQKVSLKDGKLELSVQTR